jgi:pimeloyl-ACP methyl ester carboxylesterase
VRTSEARAIARLVAEGLGEGSRFVERTHAGIAERVFRHAPAPPPVRLAHDGIARAVYGGVRGGLRGAGFAATALAMRGALDDATPLDCDPRGSVILGVLNGLWGDRIAERYPELALGMEVRRHGQPVALDAEGVRSGFPDATSRIAVFVHGLGETDQSWRLLPGQPERTDRRTYGERLQDELSYTPVHLRYNTGLHISDNGGHLAERLDQLIAAWPVGVEELVLVGHSMGGLVARSACHLGDRAGARFPQAVRHVFCLGTPQLGADLEKALNVLAWTLARLPETRALADVLRARSVGIKDLRFGSLSEEDWIGADPDEFLRDRGEEVPFLPDAHYYFVGASVGPDPLRRLVGDLLVRLPSASGRAGGHGRRIPFEVDNGLELPGVNHFALLNHPAVYEQIRACIVRGRRRPRAALPAPPARGLLPA